MNNPTETHKTEVRNAVETIRNEYVSRDWIEDTIRDGPDRYPILAAETQKHLRTIITKVMNRSFPIWSSTNRGKVWQIR